MTTAPSPQREDKIFFKYILFIKWNAMYCKREKVLYPLTWRKKVSKILYLGKKTKVQNLVSAPFLWGLGDGYWNLHFYLLHRYKETQRRHTKWLLSHTAGRTTTVQTTLEDNLRGSGNAEGVHISTPAIPTYGLHPRETRTPRPGDPHENAHRTLPVTVRGCKQMRENSWLQNTCSLKPFPWKF